jgi:hypothetical protein
MQSPTCPKKTRCEQRVFVAEFMPASPWAATIQAKNDAIG